MFVHLHLHSPYSFLDGVSHLKVLVEQAREWEMPALALTDHNTMGGAVRFTRLAQKAGIKPILGSEVTMEDGSHLVLLAPDPEGYTSLCHILTAAHLENEREQPRVSLASLEQHHQHLLALSGCRRGLIPRLLLQRRYPEAYQAAKHLAGIFGRERFFIELQNTLLPATWKLNRRLAELAKRLRLHTVATNNVHYAAKSDFYLHDLLTCVRHHITVEDPHPARRLNAENYIKSPAAMQALFTAYPEAVANTVAIASACRPALDLSGGLVPHFPVEPGDTAAAYLRRLVEHGACERYGGMSPPVRERLEHELAVITSLHLEDYFLLVWEVADWARRQGIRCSGRGSAADSAVAYCLRLSDVDPIARGLLFERFLNPERAQNPDIDLDFDARCRDRVAEYVYKRFGQDHAAAVCTYSTYLARSAVRELGAALGGFPEEELGHLAKTLPYMYADRLDWAAENLPELRRDPLWRTPPYRRLFGFCAAAAGLPRFIGTHLGGLLISPVPLLTLTPLQRSAKGVLITQFDKDDIEELGLVKLDLLSLRALSAIEDTTAVLSRRVPDFDYERIPLDDRKTFRFLNTGDTVGVFQLESPAQRALQARLKADNMEDIVASVALIRPGPIKGNMVDPYVARRQGLEPVSYLHPKLEPILEKTYGVVLFQEQVIAIATSVAGFTPGEADALRRVMTHARSHRDMQSIGQEFVARSVGNGLDEKTAATIFACLEGYASYGFCEAHAAAFGNHAYKTAYLASHYPAEYFAALLSNQPMGFYPPRTLAVAARRLGIDFLPPDVNRSEACFSVEGRSIRVSLSQVYGVEKREVESILAARKAGDFRSLPDFLSRVRISRENLARLVLCGAFDNINANRRALLWQAHASGIMTAENPGLVGLGMDFPEPQLPAHLQDFSEQEKRALEYALLEMDINHHYMSYWRPYLSSLGYSSSSDLSRLSDKTRVKVAGLVIRPHRPPTRSGKTVVFLSLEDETGIIDVTVFEDIYRKFGHLLFNPQHFPLRVAGIISRRGNGVSVNAQVIKPLYSLTANPAH